MDTQNQERFFYAKSFQPKSEDEVKADIVRYRDAFKSKDMEKFFENSFHIIHTWQPGNKSLVEWLGELSGFSRDKSDDIVWEIVYEMNEAEKPDTYSAVCRNDDELSVIGVYSTLDKAISACIEYDKGFDIHECLTRNDFEDVVTWHGEVDQWVFKHSQWFDFRLIVQKTKLNGNGWLNIDSGHEVWNPVLRAYLDEDEISA